MLGEGWGVMLCDMKTTFRWKILSTGEMFVASWVFFIVGWDGGDAWLFCSVRKPIISPGWWQALFGAGGNANIISKVW